MTANPQDFFAPFVAACHLAAHHGLVRFSSGNLSWRLPDGRVAISARGSWLANLAADQIALCDLDSGAHLDGPAPSVETWMHLAVMRARTDANAVLHFQSPYATVLACGDPPEAGYAVIPEVPLYIGPPATVPYITPGTIDLANAVAAAFQDNAPEHNLVVMRNHGMMVIGNDFNEAIQRAGFFELACQVIVQAELPANRLTEEHIQALRAYLQK